MKSVVPLKPFGAILYLLYALSLGAYFVNESSNNFLTFSVLLLFIGNIMWILVFYAIFLQENKENILQLRITIVLRVSFFLVLNLFRLIDGFGVISSLPMILYTVYSIANVAIILYVDAQLPSEINYT